MTLDLGIRLQLGNGTEFLGQGHFVVAIMNAIVAQPTNQDTLIQFRFGVTLLQPGTTMKFFRNEVMKSELHPAATKGTGIDAIAGHRIGLDYSLISHHFTQRSKRVQLHN